MQCRNGVSVGKIYICPLAKKGTGGKANVVRRGNRAFWGVRYKGEQNSWPGMHFHQTKTIPSSVIFRQHCYSALNMHTSSQNVKPPARIHRGV